MALGSILARLSLDNSDFVKEINKAKRLGESISNLGAKMSLGLTLPIVALGKMSGEAFARYDSLKKALDTITGSSAVTTKRMEELREAAKAPGLGFEEAIQGDVRLQAVGTSAAQSIRILKEFGNTIAKTGGGKAELASVTVQLGQMIAKGKVYAQDLKPIIEAAPAVGAALKEIYGTVDSESIQKALSLGGKNSTDFINTLLNKLEESPRVVGGFRNSLENVQDSLFVFSSKIGESANNVFGLEGKINKLSDALSAAGDNFQALPEPLQKIILGTVAVTAAAGPFLFILGKIPGLFIDILKGKDAILGMFAKLTGALGVPTGAGFLSTIKQLATRIPLVAAAIAGVILVFRNFKPIIESIKQFAQYWLDLYKEIKIVRVVVDGIFFAFKLLFELTAFGFEVLLKNVEFLASQFANVLGGLGAGFKAALTFDFDAIPGIIKNSFNNAGKITDRYLDNLGADFTNTLNNITSQFKQIGKEAPTGAGANSGGTVIPAKPKASGGAGLGNEPKELSDFQKILKGVNEELAKAAILQQTYGANFDLSGEQISIYQKGIEELAGEGSAQAVVKIGELVGKIAELQTGVGNVAPLKTLKKELGEIKSLDPFSTLTEKAKEQGRILSLNANEPMVKYQNSLREIDNLAISLGDDFDVVGAKTAALTTYLQDMAAKGLPVVKKVADGMANEFSKAGEIIDNFKKKIKEIGPALAEAFKNLPSQVNVQSIVETDANVKALNQTLREQSAILRDPKATEEQKKAAQIQISLTKQQIKDEKDKGNVIKQVGKTAINVAREIILAKLAEAIAGAIASASKLPPPFNIIAGGVAAAAFSGLFQAFVPKLAKGGLAYSPTLAIVGDNKNAKSDPEVIAPLSKLKNMLGDGGGDSRREIYGRLKGVDIMLSNQYTEEYYKRVS